MYYNYTEIITDLKTNAQVPADDIFEFEFSPLKAIYDQYFQFCQVNLTERCKEYNIQPAKFYYRTVYDINARAGLQNGYFIIGVNMLTIHSLYNLFYDKNDIFESAPFLLENYKTLTNTFDVPAGHLMFQLATLFTFYHERAHLIQKSDLLAASLFEQPSPVDPNEFSIERHVLELDADLDAAHKTCFHIIEYFKKLKAEDKTAINMQRLLSIGVASVFSYLLLYYNNNPRIYYAESTHPHPSVRISYIVDCFIRVGQINMPDGIKLNSGQTIREGFIIADIFYQSVLNVEIVNKFVDQFMSEKRNIEDYVNELLRIGEAIPILVKNRQH